MAQATNEYYSSVTRDADKRYDPEHIQPRNFLGVAGGPTYAQLTAVGQITASGFWKLWTNAAVDGSQVIRGFLSEEAVLDATGETLHNVILAGTIHRDDVPLNGESQVNLDAALSTSQIRELGFKIQGLPNLP